MRETLTRWRYRYWPDHLLGEILSKRWTETAIPVIVLLIVVFALSRMIDNFLSPSSSHPTPPVRRARSASSRSARVSSALSAASTFRSDRCSRSRISARPARSTFWAGRSIAVAAATMVFGALSGAINGFLVGYLRLRAFITTLITLIVYRSAFDLLIQRYSVQIASAFPTPSSTWNFIGGGDVFGVPSIAIVYLAVAIFGHIFLTRLLPGWHIVAIGGSRRSAYNSGIPVRRTIALCLSPAARQPRSGRLFFAARLGTVGGDIGVGLAGRPDGDRAGGITPSAAARAWGH